MKYAAKRIAMLLFTMVIVSLLAFVAFDVISGDPATAMLGTQATPERVAELRAELGLDRPLLVRYGEWLLGFFTGNLGTSYSYHQPVWDLIAPKVGVTLCLSLLSFVLIAVISVPLGVRSATRRSRGILNGVETLFNQLCMAVPPFFTSILLTFCFSTVLHWFVHGSFPGLGSDFFASLRYLFFAAVAIAIPRIAMTVRMLRSTIADEMGKDYVRTAISRGNDRAGVLRRHVLKNSGGHLPGPDHGGDRGRQHRGGAGLCHPGPWADAGGLHRQPGLSGGAGHHRDPGLLGGAGRHRGGPHQPAD